MLCSVQFSHSVVSDSLWPHEPQHARPPYPSPTAGVYSKPMSTESVMPSNHLILCRPLLLLPSIFPASGSFQMSKLFASGGQSIGVSASTSVLPVNTQDWSPLGWTDWISLQSKGLSRVFSINLLRYNLHKIKCIHFKCTTQWILIKLSWESHGQQGDQISQS